jgi:uncharacterized protein YjiS (DUF1127 family)
MSRFARWIGRSRGHRRRGTIAMLDDRLLRDIGLTRMKAVDDLSG